MSKKTFKLSELKQTLPDSGQFPEQEVGDSGKVYQGLKPYDYSDLKASLEAKGYKPEDFDYITADENGNVKYGGRRVWLMQKDMEWDDNTEIEVELMTASEMMADLQKRMTPDAKPTRASDGTITPPKQKLEVPARHSYPNLVKFHKKRSDIEGYTYDYVSADGEVVDAGKS
jgi:hypothetical protein